MKKPPGNLGMQSATKPARSKTAFLHVEANGTLLDSIMLVILRTSKAITGKFWELAIRESAKVQVIGGNRTLL